MNQQLLGGSENYSKLKNPLDHQQQLRDDEQDSFNYQQTIQKKQHDKQEVLSKVNKKIESIKIEKDQDETQQGIENDLNLLIQILYDKHQEIVISDQSIEIKKEISKGEQKIEQLQNSTNIQQIYMASKSSDYVSECASNQYSIPQFEQKGVQRFQSTKENLISLEQNKKNKLNKAQQNLKLNCEQFLREIFQLGDHLNSGGEADIFIHKNDESIAYRVIKVKNDEDLDEQLLELQSIKVLNEQNILDLNVSHMLEDRINNNMYLIHVMQKCEMSLQDEIISNKSFSLNEILSLISTGFHLLIALRQKYIYHSDIKPGNILKIGDDNYKLSDFGASQKVNFNDPFTEWKMATMAFIPKKQTLDLPFYHDIYSFGKTIEMVLQQLENHQEIKLSLQQFMNEDLCRDDENSIQTNCFELPKKKHRKEEVLKEITTLNVEMQNRQFSQYSLENEKTLNLSLKKIYNLTQINMPCFTFFISKLTNITTLKLQLKQYLNETININNEVNSVLLNIDLFINALPLQNITHLTLDNGQTRINIGKYGSYETANILERCQNITELNLNFSVTDNINVLENWASIIASALQKCQNIAKLSLDLSKNQIKIDEVQSFVSALENCLLLNQLHINLNQNFIGNEITQCVVSIVENCQCLTDLNLELSANFINDDGVYTIATSLILCQNIVKLSLNLSLNNISIDGAVSLTTALENNFSIKQLNINLSGNQIGNEVAQCVVNIIQTSESLTNLSVGLDINSINDEGVQIIANALNNCKNITEFQIGLKQNYINLKGASILLKALENSQQFKIASFDLSENYIEEEELKKLIKAFIINREEFKSQQNEISNQISDITSKDLDQLIQIDQSREYNLLMEQHSLITNNPQVNLDENLTTNQINLNSSSDQISDTNLFNITKELKNITLSDFYINWKNVFISIAKNIDQYLDQNKFKEFNLNLILQQSTSENLCFNNFEEINKQIYLHSLSLIQNSDRQQKYQIQENEQNLSLQVEQLDLLLNFNLISEKVSQIVDFILKKYKKKVKFNLPSNSSQALNDQTALASLENFQNKIRINIRSSGKCISLEGAQKIFNSLAKCQNVSYLNLNLSKSSINNQIAQIIAQGLKHMNVITELNLNLSYNDIGIQGAKHISNALKKCRNIIQLDIDLDQNNIQDEGAQSIVDTFVNCQSMITFNLKLKKNQIGRGTLKSIANTLGKCQNITQLHLNLNQNNMVKDDSDFIADILSQCKNVNQLDINLESNNISDIGVQNIVKGLEKCENLNFLHLNLKENKINAEGVSTLAKALERCDKITNLYLNLKRNQIDDQGFNNAMGIMFKNKNISIFNINFNCCNIGANNSLVVSNNFEQCQNIIELTLKLKLNLIGIEAAKNIANVLKKCQNLTKLNINLARNYQIKPSKDNFGDDEIEIIANSLLDYQNLTELSLNSSANNISCSGAKSIAVALGHCRNLKILNLDISNNKITSEGKQFIADSLEKCQNINKLNLSLGNNSQVDIINNNEPNIIADTLQNIENITELSLDFQVNISSIQAKNVYKILEKCQNVTQLTLKFIKFMNLNLRENIDIQFDGTQNFADQLQKLQKITRLELILLQNYIGDQRTQIIAGALEKCLNITQMKLDLRLNRIGVEGIQSIVNALKKCYKITNLALNLQNNSIGNKGAQIIANALENCQNITELFLDLTFNDIDINGNKILVTALENNQNIRSLELNLDRGKVHFK